MQELPLVSVLMTSYNREKYIAEAINSVLGSTYTNFELIVCDDGSKDNTVTIAREIQRRDQRVKVFINEKNLGDYPNRNQAAAHATGKYLKYVDADDYLYPWGLELLVSMMEQFPDAGWGLCSLEQYSKKPFPFLLSPAEAYKYHYFEGGLFHKAPLSSIIRRDIFNEAGGFAPIRMAGDFEMWHRLAQKYPVLLMPHGIVWYREHDAQEMNAHHQYIAVYEKIRIGYLTDPHCPLERDLINKILEKNKTAIRRQALKNVLSLKWKKAAETWNRLSKYK